MAGLTSRGVCLCFFVKIPGYQKHRLQALGSESLESGTKSGAPSSKSGAGFLGALIFLSHLVSRGS